MRLLLITITSLLFLCVTSPIISASSKNDLPDTNTIGMRLVPIEPGSFLMGSEGAGENFDEAPAHKVKISRGFFMSTTEVTNAQYEAFDPSHREYRGRHGISSDDDEAVVYVSWHDAVRFCQWLSGKEGKPYRLPTEAEWEYACRAGTTTAFNTGDELPEIYYNNQQSERKPVPVKLHVGRTPPNALGLYEMHGNVEEWCHDWYGPYSGKSVTDPVGYAEGDFKVTRGGSHSTEVAYLRSANRMGTLPEDKHWLIGFRVVMGELPETEPMAERPVQPWAQDVKQSRCNWENGPDPNEPFFKEPREYVKIPPDSNGPLYSKHNHQPAITACPNGDLMTIWFSTNREQGRELGVAASRLRKGSEEWEPAAPFWNVPDRNDTGSDIWWDGENTIYHFNGLSHESRWHMPALVMRTSTDNGATWSKPRLIGPEHKMHHQVIAGTSHLPSGEIMMTCDAVPDGSGGTAIHLSSDGGKTWRDPSAGKPTPVFEEGGTGAWPAGIHGGVVGLKDGRILAFGRGDDIGAHMPRSISNDMGETWTYSASEFPPISSGQRLVLMRLREGPLLFVSFTDRREYIDLPDGSEERIFTSKGILIPDAEGKEQRVYGMYAALSFDEGETWPVKKLVTDGGSGHKLDGGAWTGEFTMDATHAEPMGYLHATQSPDGVIHLISSKQYYAFNLAWLKTPMSTQ